MRKWILHTTKIILAFSLFFSLGLSGQEQLGQIFSSYSGISPLQVNPALMTGSRVYVDLNVVGANSSFSNDIIYFSADNRTVQKLIKFDTANFSNGDFNYGRTYTYYLNTNKKYVLASVKVLGPSLMFQNGRHAFGLSTSSRSVHSSNRLPYEIPVFVYEGLSFEKLQNIEYDDNNFGIVSMSWAEIGLSYAYDIYKQYGNQLSIGVTVKALLGYEGAYLNFRNINYVVYNDSSIDFRNLDAEIGYSLPIGYEGEVESNLEPLIKGIGVGVDVGVVYTKLKSTYHGERKMPICAKPYQDYIFKVGLSILDLGGINFNKSAQKHEFNNVSKYWEDYDTTQFLGLDYAVRLYSDAFYGDPDASYSGDNFRIGLPTALSLQFDYHFRNNYYFSALWIHPLKLNPTTLWRPPQLAVIPRYENKYIGVSLPLSLYNYNEPRVGLSVRLYYVTIGTDRLGSWLGVSDWSGMDIYFSIRLNIQKGKCNAYSRGACSNSDFGNKW